MNKDLGCNNPPVLESSVIEKMIYGGDFFQTLNSFEYKILKGHWWSRNYPNITQPNSLTDSINKFNRSELETLIERMESW